MRWNPENRNHRSITFFIDGVEYSTEDRHQTAEELLSLAGLDAANHDLAELKGKEIRKHYKDAAEVHLAPNARFVSIFTGSTPVA